jgi:PEP-CTERM motif
MRFWCCALGSIALLLCAIDSEATPVSYSFTGTIDSQTGASAPAVGSAISGTVTYDPDAPLLFLGGNFSDWSPASAASLTAVVGGTPYSATPPAIDEYVVHNVPVGYPNIPAGQYDDLAIAAGSPTLTLYFLDDTASAFSTFNALPASLSLADFQYFDLWVAGSTVGESSFGLVQLTPVETTAVPEPGTVALVGIGLAGGFARRRRRALTEAG